MNNGDDETQGSVLSLTHFKEGYALGENKGTDQETGVANANPSPYENTHIIPSLVYSFIHLNIY